MSGKIKFLGLEDLEEGASAIPEDNFESPALIPEAELGHDADDLDAHAEAIAEARDEATAASDAVETGFDVTEKLGEINATMESILSSGENITGAALLYVKGVKAQMSRLDLTAARCIPSFENLEADASEIEKVIEATASGEVSSDTKDRGEENDPNPIVADASAADAANTENKHVDSDTTAEITADEVKASVEGLGSVVGKMFSKIADNLRKVAKSISDHFARAFTGLQAIRRRAHLQKAALKELSGAAKAEKFTAGGLHRLSYNGKVDVKSILTGLSNSGKLADYLFGGYAKTIGGYYTDVAKVYTEHSIFSKEIYAQELTAIHALHERLQKDVKVATGSMSNDFRVSGDRVLELQHGYLPDLTKAKGAVSVTSKQEVDVPSLREIGTVLDSVIHMVDQINREHQVWYTVFALQEKALADAEKALESRKSADSKYNNSETLSWATFSLMMPVSEFVDYNFATLRSALAYAEKAAGQYSRA